MPTISLRLPETLVEQISRLAKAQHIPRSEYIRRALERMNREVEAELRRARMAEASRRLRKESMAVNAEFDAIEREPQ